MGIIYLFILMNGMVFLSWMLSPSWISQSFMMDHFLVSWDALIEGRWWTLLTSVFSHVQLFHIALNMMVLRSFGPIIVYTLGLRAFLIFYLIAGVVSSFSHSLLSLLIMHDPSIPALGASGALAGIILLFSLLFPREKLLFLGIIPIRAIWGALLFIGLDVWGLIAQSKGGGLPIGHGAHLGGAFVGIMYYLIVRNTKTSTE